MRGMDGFGWGGRRERRAGGRGHGRTRRSIARSPAPPCAAAVLAVREGPGRFLTNAFTNWVRKCFWSADSSASVTPFLFRTCDGASLADIPARTSGWVSGASRG